MAAFSRSHRHVIRAIYKPLLGTRRIGNNYARNANAKGLWGWTAADAGDITLEKSREAKVFYRILGSDRLVIKCLAFFRLFFVSLKSCSTLLAILWRSLVCLRGFGR